jgi:hypothetical protein
MAAAPEISRKRVSPAAALAVVAALSLWAAMAALVSVKQVSVKHGPEKDGAEFTWRARHDHHSFAKL